MAKLKVKVKAKVNVCAHGGRTIARQQYPDSQTRQAEAATIRQSQ